MESTPATLSPTPSANQDVNQPATTDLELGVELDTKIYSVKREIKDEYRATHTKPWIIGFSGGKDSTLVLHLVVECLLELPASQRTRAVYVIANDTLVESPIVQSYVDEILRFLEKALRDLQLPVTVVKTHPVTLQSFWVNLIGRGYPSPTRFFRWCTDRMKIRPTTEYVKSKVSENGEVILLLGVRRSESSARAASARRYDNGGRLNRHNDIPGCLVYRPILELDTEDVWEFLMNSRAPWGGSHGALVQLYRDAVGGECPVVIDPDAQPSCGSSSIRFGCWTCTVVEKDKSFRSHLEKGFERLIPMAEFRDWLKVFCYERENRMTQRRNGQDGLGPLTFDARRTVLDRLLKLQQVVDQPLITAEEVAAIRRIWADDQSIHLFRRTDHLIGLLGGK
jgi:DNA sulfur modification protein DndC